MKEYSVVGKPLKRVDGTVKVTGRAKYSGDITLPNMLHGKILRSPHPHARIVNIDTSKAKALPGVKAVIIGSETPGIRFGFVDTPRYPADEYPLAIYKVRYIGEEVVCENCIEKGEWDFITEEKLITESDMEKSDDLYFCDRCKKRIEPY